MRTASGAEAASHRVDVRRPRRSRSGGARGRAFVVGMALGLIGTGCAGSPAPKDAAGGAAETARAWNRLDLLDHLASIGDGTSEWDDLETARRFAQLQGAIEVLRELVLHDATSEQEASEGLRVVLKVLAMAVVRSSGVVRKSIRKASSAVHSPTVPTRRSSTRPPRC